MNIKKLLTGGITGGILFFLLGYLVYGNLLVSFMKANPGTALNVDRDSPDLLFLAIGNLLMGLLLAWIFVKSGVSTVASGLISGGTIGLLVSTSMDCIIYATTHTLSRKAMMADVLAFTLISAVTGAIVAMVIGMNKKN